MRPASPRLPIVSRLAAPLLASCAALLLAHPGRAAEPPARLDSLAATVDGLAAFGFTGQIVVAEGDSILIERSAGIADASGRPVGPRTRFALGSITKSLTGAVAVRLAARGALGLDQPLAELLDHVPADKARLTLRQLLTHTSGLPADADSVREEDPRDVVLRKTLNQPLRFEPGAGYHYSNAGFQLAAAALERASGQPFGALVEAEILGPCGMTDSGVGPAAARETDDVAAGRNEWMLLGSPRDWRQPWAGTGAGDLVSTARDQFRWARALQGAGPLTAGELDTLLARRVPAGERMHYGFGVYAVPAAEGPDVISIGGNIPGFHASAWIERRPPWRIIVVVSSGDRFGRSLAVTTVQRRLWGMMGGAPALLPPATATWPRDRLEALAGGWRLPRDGRFDLAVVGDGMRIGISGTESMDMIFGADTTGGRDRADARARAVLAAAAGSDRSTLDQALHPVERELWAEALQAGVRRAINRFGRVLEVEDQGTIPMPWLDRGLRTYARLRCASGDADVSLAWLDGALLDVSFGEGRPHPVLLPVAPLAEGGLAAWDVLDGTTIRIEPFRDKRGDGLRLTGAGGSSIARRVKR